MFERLVYLVAIVGAVTALNRVVFKHRPATRRAAWLWTTGVWVVSLVVLSFAKVLRYSRLSEQLGREVVPRDELDVLGATLAAVVFFALLKRAGNARV